jgi:purine-binding chemotaxis protein CheW
MSLDWEGARARLRAAQERLDVIDQEVGDFEALLHSRSDAIAAANAAPSAAGIADLVVFAIGNARFAVDAVEIAEVIDVPALTALPGVPPLYHGLLSHRGIAFPLLDIRPLVGRAADAHGTFAHALLFVSEAQTVAVGADAIEGMVRVDDATIDPSPAPAIRGATSDGAVVLDVWVLLADPRLVVDG